MFYYLLVWSIALLNSFPTIIFANILYSGHDQQNIQPDLDPNCMKLWSTLIMCLNKGKEGKKMYIWKKNLRVETIVVMVIRIEGFKLSICLSLSYTVTILPVILILAKWKKENPSSIRCLTMLLWWLHDSSTDPLRFMAAVLWFTTVELQMLTMCPRCDRVQTGSATASSSYCICD